MNGDGIPDIVRNGITVLFGDGTGAFATRCDYLQEGFGRIILSDFDGDGNTDIIAFEGVGDADALAGTTLSVLFGRGGGEFTATLVSIASEEHTVSTVTYILPVDFNGDGVVDVAIWRHILSCGLTGTRQWTIHAKL